MVKLEMYIPEFGILADAAARQIPCMLTLILDQMGNTKEEKQG